MTVEYTPEFKRGARKLSRQYRSLKRDLAPLLTALAAGETPGDALQHTQYPTFKVRVRNSDARRGKSGGYRAIYYLKRADKAVLVTLYSKSHQSDIMPDEVRRIVAKYEANTSGA